MKLDKWDQQALYYATIVLSEARVDKEVELNEIESKLIKGEENEEAFDWVKVFRRNIRYVDRAIEIIEEILELR